ncbi:MAG: hypothetical protein H6737_08535 [Alphaproteobacteria bacterium]|nr:hypothetical protein [Alphaproteobacteria bacterium]
MRTALLALMFPSLAYGYIDPKCADTVLPSNYDEQAQADFLANYVALATSYSPVHGPIPHKPGHGAIGLDLGFIPPLSCKRRLVLQGTKTEDTNKTPVAPRFRATFAFPSIGRVVPYAGAAYIPPVKLLGTTNVIVSGELGAGIPIGEIFQVGGRFHYTLGKTVGEIATPFVEGDTPYEDIYIGSTFGLDAIVGFDLGEVVPYVAGGYMDASTFFYIGDDAVVTNNLHPYFGPTFSAGVDGLVKERFRFGAEFYGAPGGYSKPIKEIPDVKPAGRYGSVYTARIRLAVEL